MSAAVQKSPFRAAVDSRPLRRGLLAVLVVALLVFPFVWDNDADIDSIANAAAYAALALGLNIVVGFAGLLDLGYAAFFLGSALAGAGGLMFGLYYNFTSYIIGFTAGLRAFTAAVLGGIGNVPGAMLGGIIIGLIEAMGGQLISASWADVIIFSILVLVLVFRPAGLLGRVAPNKS